MAWLAAGCCQRAAVVCCLLHGSQVLHRGADARATSSESVGDIFIVWKHWSYRGTIPEVLMPKGEGSGAEGSAVTWSSVGSQGPAIGGWLAEPAKRFPSIFVGTVFETYPYLLPCLASSCLSLTGLIMAIFFIQETLDPKFRST